MSADALPRIDVKAANSHPGDHRWAVICAKSTGVDALFQRYESAHEANRVAAVLRSWGAAVRVDELVAEPEKAI